MNNYDKKVERCHKCKQWIRFLDNTIGIEVGRMGQDSTWKSGFITYKKETGKYDKYFFHESCFEKEILE